LPAGGGSLSSAVLFQVRREQAAVSQDNQSGGVEEAVVQVGLEPGQQALPGKESSLHRVTPRGWERRGYVREWNQRGHSAALQANARGFLTRAPFSRFTTKA